MKISHVYHAQLNVYMYNMYKGISGIFMERRVSYFPHFKKSQYYSEKENIE